MNPRGGHRIKVPIIALIISALVGSGIFYFAVELGVNPTVAFFVSYSLVFAAVFGISIALSRKGVIVSKRKS